MDPKWHLESIQLLTEDLGDVTNHSTQVLLKCGQTAYDDLITIAQNFLSATTTESSYSSLDSMIIESRSKITFKGTGALAGWMRLYTDSSLLKTLADVGPLNALESIARLDELIITCGPASGRLDFILTTIKHIQRTYLDFDPYTLDVTPATLSLYYHETCLRSQSNILVLPKAPSLHSFQTKLSKNPFVVRCYARDWPALVEHPWRSAGYLKSISGPGRVVPVEIGVDYRAQEWTQGLMSWDAFLAYLDLDDSSSPSKDTKSEMIYLAQHNLLLQFPELLADIVIPDYVYASMSPPNHCDYQPPGNDEQLVTNMWLGPKGTVSPAHTDPYYNIFVQIVGRKTVWLAPPELSASMYPLSSNEGFHNPAMNLSEPGLSNTSKIDVFAPATEEFPHFSKNVLPEALATVLEPGDLLFLPPGWWHAMRSEETSFSLSMWF